MGKRKLKTLFDYGKAKAAPFSVLPPSIIPVVFLSGSDYQMGFQYGQQAGQYIEMIKEASWVEVLQEQSREEVLNSLKRFRYYIDKYTPEAIEQIKGMVDGSKAAGYEISFGDVLVINCVPKKMPQNTLLTDFLSAHTALLADHVWTPGTDKRIIGNRAKKSQEISP